MNKDLRLSTVLVIDILAIIVILVSLNISELNHHKNWPENLYEDDVMHDVDDNLPQFDKEVSIASEFEDNIQPNIVALTWRGFHPFDFPSLGRRYVI